MYVATRILAIAISAISLVAHSETSTPRRALLDLVTAIESRDGLGSAGPDKATQLAVELGDAAVPLLQDLLSAAVDPSKGSRIAWVMAYSGGPKALAALGEFAKKSADVNSRAPLLFAFPSASSQQETAVLIESLVGEHIGSEWFPIVQAALSLGIMRERRAIPALTRAAEKRKGFASDAAQMALDWMHASPPKPTIVEPSENDDLVTAILEFPVSAFARFPQLCEFGKRHRKWRRADSAWTIEPGCAPEDSTPRIFFNSYRSSDGNRAVVAVGFVAGRLDGVGYNYLLHRQGGTWIVVGIQPTWIS